jgi:hemin uptake protein HemP
MSPAPAEDDDPETENNDEPTVFAAKDLFAGKREVWIDLDGIRYRLRITRRGKMILQK